MSRNQLQTANQFDSFKSRERKRLEGIDATLGNGHGLVDIGDSGFVWARLYGDGRRLIRVRDVAETLKIDNTPILVERVNESQKALYRFVGRNSDRAYSSDPQSNTVAKHALQHEDADRGTGGFDKVRIFNRALAEVKAVAFANPGMSVFVTPGPFTVNGNWNYWAGGNTPVFVAPALTRMDLIYLGADLALHVLAGSDMASPPTPPVVPDNVFPIAWVFLTSATTAISETELANAKIIGSQTFPPAVVIPPYSNPMTTLGDMVYEDISGANLVRFPAGGVASYSAVNSYSGSYLPDKAADGDITTDWVASGLPHPCWWRVDFTVAQIVGRVILRNRNNGVDQFGSTGTITFSDGSSVPFSGLALGGAPLTIDFPVKSGITWIQANGDALAGANAGLAEVEAYAESATRLPIGTVGQVLQVVSGLPAWGSLTTPIHAATSKVTPVDADEIPLADSAASWGLKKLTWANIKATLKTYFDGFYSLIGHTHSYLSSALTSAHIFVGNGSNVATDVAMSGDATISNTGALTLATANANVGTFGSATQVGQFTVDAKGRITAASNVAIAAGGTPGGSNTQVQYNDSGVFGGDAGLVWDKTNKVLTIAHTAPKFVMTNTTGGAKSLTIAVGATANIADFRESAGASGSLLALDLANKRVGIGTNAPSFDFEIYGTNSPSIKVNNGSTTGYSQVLLSNTTGNVCQFFVNGSAQATYGGANSFNILTAGNYPITFNTNNVARAIILGNGNVGIVTLNPVVPFQVKGVSSFFVSDTGRGLTIDPGLTTGVVNIYTDYLGGSQPNLHLASYSDRAGANGITIINGGSVGIGTSSPTNLLSLGGNSARTIWMERHTVSNSVGNPLTVQAGGATSGATNKLGGDAIFAAGLGTGNAGSGKVRLQVAPPGSSGTADNTLADGLVIDNYGNASLGAATTTGKNRLFIPGGTAIAVGDVVLGAGWGANAVVTAVSGNDMRGTITVTTSALDTPLATPSLTLTFKDGTWTSVPLAIANINDQSTGTLAAASCHCTATTLVISYDGTPTALLSRTYVFNYVCLG